MNGIANKLYLLIKVSEPYIGYLYVTSEPSNASFGYPLNLFIHAIN